MRRQSEHLRLTERSTFSGHPPAHSHLMQFKMELHFICRTSLAKTVQQIHYDSANDYQNVGHYKWLQSTKS